MRFPIDPEGYALCSVDPITLVGIALAGVAGAIGSSAVSNMGDSSAAQAKDPVDAAKASTPAMLQPTSQKIKPKSNTPSFVGGSATPDNRSFGTKTLLGQ